MKTTETVTFRPKRLNGNIKTSFMPKPKEYRIIEHSEGWAIEKRYLQAELVKKKQWHRLWPKYSARLIDEWLTVHYLVNENWIDIGFSFRIPTTRQIEKKYFATKKEAEEALKEIKQQDLKPF